MKINHREHRVYTEDTEKRKIFNISPCPLWLIFLFIS